MGTGVGMKGGHTVGPREQSKAGVRRPQSFRIDRYTFEHLAEKAPSGLVGGRGGGGGDT